MLNKQRICTACGGHEAIQQDGSAKTNNAPLILTGHCYFCNGTRLRPAKPGEAAVKARKFLAIGGFAWGQGATAEDAGQQLLAHWPRFAPTKGNQAQLLDVPMDAYVDAQGNVIYAKGQAAPVVLLTTTMDR